MRDPFLDEAMTFEVPGETVHTPLLRAAVSGRGVSGTEISGAIARDQRLRVGERTLPVERLFVRAGFGDGVQGLVGMDVLRGTVLMVAAVERPVLWLLPGVSSR